jgi:hypothetical protein
LERGIEGALSGLRYRQQPAVHDHSAAGVEIIANLIGDWRMLHADPRSPWPRRTDRCLETRCVALARNNVPITLAEATHDIRPEWGEQIRLAKRSCSVGAVAGRRCRARDDDGAEREKSPAIDSVGAVQLKECEHWRAS